jgi:glyoxylase-like metal-dependent hydrolase (beta-lactamase superfamily II)
MQEIRTGLGLARGMIVSNVWLLEHAGRRLLVDSGHPLERLTLAYHLWRAGVRREGDLDAVILTHRHSDHAGNAAWLRRRFGCVVACHVADAEELSGARPLARLARWPSSPIDYLLCRVEDRFPARSVVDEAFPDGAWRFGLRVVHVPGHTSGSVLLHHEPTGTLFTGDAILSGVPPLRWFERPTLAKAVYSSDVARCHSTTRAFLSDLPPTRTFCAGHGPAITERVEEKLRRLAT